MPTEQVNWKTGGVLKTIATDGIVKGDVNGQVAPRRAAGRSKNSLDCVILERASHRSFTLRQTHP